MNTFKTLSDKDLEVVEGRWLERRDRLSKELWECNDKLTQIHLEKSDRGWYAKRNQEWLEEFRENLGKEG